MFKFHSGLRIQNFNQFVLKLQLAIPKIMRLNPKPQERRISKAALPSKRNTVSNYSVKLGYWISYKSSYQEAWSAPFTERETGHRQF